MGLYEMLAEAYSQPSRGYQTFTEGVGAIENIDKGFQAARKRKLDQSTLAELLGGRMIPGLEPLSDLKGDQIKAVSPLAAFMDKEKDNTPRTMDAILAEAVRTGEMSIDDAYTKKNRGLLLRGGLEEGPDGTLTQVPGGEPYRKTAKTEKAAAGVSGKLQALRGLYQKLNESKGIVSTDRGALLNLKSSAAASWPGQLFGKMTGTKDQSLRNQINTLRPLIINDIRAASEMGARGLDSEKELEFYLQAASEPQADFQANMATLDNLERAYGNWQADVAAFNRKGGGGVKVKVSNGTETREIDPIDIPEAAKDGYYPQ